MPDTAERKEGGTFYIRVPGQWEIGVTSALVDRFSSVLVDVGALFVRDQSPIGTPFPAKKSHRRHKRQGVPFFCQEFRIARRQCVHGGGTPPFSVADDVHTRRHPLSFPRAHACRWAVSLGGVCETTRRALLSPGAKLFVQRGARTMAIGGQERPNCRRPLG